MSRKRIPLTLDETPVSTRFTPEQIDSLDRYAGDDRHGIRSIIIRSAVDRYIAQREAGEIAPTAATARAPRAAAVQTGA